MSYIMRLVCAVICCFLLTNSLNYCKGATAVKEAVVQDNKEQEAVSSDGLVEVSYSKERGEHIIHIKGICDITKEVDNALRAGGVIRLSGGIGLISQPLVIYKDNTHFIIDTNTILKWTHPSYGVILRTVYTVNKKTILNNVSVEGGIWEMGGANKNTGGPPAIMMIGVKNLRVSNITMYDPYKFFFGFGGIDGFEISNITMYLRNTSIAGKDGLHFAGGVRNGTVSNIRGNTTDDLVALNFGGDIVGDDSKSEMMSVGDSYNVTVMNVFSENARQAVRLLADDVYKCTDITVDGVYGVVKNHSCISISGWMYEGHTARFGDITLSNIHVQTPNTIDEGYEAWHSPIILIGNHWNRIVPCYIKSLTINGCVVTQSKGMLQTPIRVVGNTIIDSLLIDGLIVNTIGELDLGKHSVIDIGHSGQNAKIKNLTLTNSYIERASIPFEALIRIENKGSVVENAKIFNNFQGTVIPKNSRRFEVKNNKNL